MSEERRISYSQAIREAIAEELECDVSLVVLGDDILDSARRSTLLGLPEKYPNRIMLENPLIEDMWGGIALGMALGGIHPVIQFNNPAFLALAWSDLHQIISWRYRMALAKNPSIIFRISASSYMGMGPEFGPTFLSSYFHLPNLWIAAPSTPYYAKGLLKAAIHAERPVLFFEHKLLYDVQGVVPEKEYAVQFPAAEILRVGRAITVVSWSITVVLALAAASILAGDGIDTEVLALQTLQPLDEDALFRSVQKTGRVVIVEEGMIRGGIGAEIGMQILSKFPSAIVRRVGAKNVPPASRPPYEKLILPQTKDIVLAVRSLVVGH